MIPPEVTLGQNNPNPFNPSTTISYSLPRASEVQLAVYNLKGQLVRSLVEGPRPSGEHQIVWDGEDRHGNGVSSGVYLIRLRYNGKVITHKALMLK
jgi:flagellar hook assembly protein FlgD